MKTDIVKEGKIGTRPSWDEYFMKSAIVAASRASCFNVHSGTVIVHDKTIVATGYNGVNGLTKNCLDKGYCHKEKKTGLPFEQTMNCGYCIGTHSEMNALAHMNRIVHQDATLYTTVFPCNNCMKNILAARVKRIVYKRIYDEKEMINSLEMCEEAGVIVEQLDMSPERCLDIDLNHPTVKYDVWTPNQRKLVGASLMCKLEKKRKKK